MEEVSKVLYDKVDDTFLNHSVTRSIGVKVGIAEEVK